MRTRPEAGASGASMHPTALTGLNYLPCKGPHLAARVHHIQYPLPTAYSDASMQSIRTEMNHTSAVLGCVGPSGPSKLDRDMEVAKAWWTDV